MRRILQIIPSPAELYAYYEQLPNEAKQNRSVQEVQRRIACLALCEENGETTVRAMLAVALYDDSSNEFVFADEIEYFHSLCFAAQGDNSELRNISSALNGIWGTLDETV